jgi:lipid-A-disaccharide synthase
LENPTDNNLSLFISAGETSGDLHGSGLINSLKEQSGKNIKVTALGGDNMKSAGANLLYHVKDLSTIGFIDVIKKYSFFNKVLNESISFVKNNNPDAVILIDYPGFNLKLAERLREFYRKKIIYYISPQIWAWHRKRAFKIKKYIDKMLVVFPFEKDFYKEYGIDAEYVGHPLITRINEFLLANKKEPKAFGAEKIITILPGSRKDEIRKHLPVLIETARQLRKEFDTRIFISKAPGLTNEIFEMPGEELKEFIFTDENIYKLILNSDVVLTKAGTSTVECALIGNPFLIFYRTSPFNYYLLKPIVKVDRLGMVNILANEMIIKEFVQNDFTAENLLYEIRKILTDINYRNTIIGKLKHIREVLGTKDASLNASKIILNEIK